MTGLGWWVISGDDLLAMLRRAHDGEDPDLIYVEEYANSESRWFRSPTSVGAASGSGSAAAGVVLPMKSEKRPREGWPMERKARASAALADALRWVIEHKSCSGFPQCWAAAPDHIKVAIETAWGSDPWPTTK